MIDICRSLEWVNGRCLQTPSSTATVFPSETEQRSEEAMSIPEVPTGKLTFKDFGVLANLLRRFEVHHAEQFAPGVVEAHRNRLIAIDAGNLVRKVYTELYVPAGDEIQAARRRGMDEEKRRQRFVEARESLLATAARHGVRTPTEDVLRRGAALMDQDDALEEHRARGFVDPRTVVMTAGPNPISVSELLNQNSIEDAAGLASWRD